MPEGRVEAISVKLPKHMIQVPLMELFMRHVTKTDNCWLWTAGKDKNGYGLASKGRGQTGTCRAHRRAWELFKGTIPIEMMVLHRCDNPPCVNPDHLFLGTNSDNMRDAHAKGRHKSPTQAKPESQVRGERQHLAKLNATKVKLIFLYHNAGLKYREIARRIGIANTTVGNVIRRETWNHIAI